MELYVVPNELELTAGSAGEVSCAVPLLDACTFSLPDRVNGSFLGEIFILVCALLLVALSLSSSLFFNIPSLELGLSGAGFFSGEGPIRSSDMLSSLSSEFLFRWNASTFFSSELLRTWMRTRNKTKIGFEKKNCRHESVIRTALNCHYLLCLWLCIQHGKCSGKVFIFMNLLLQLSNSQLRKKTKNKKNTYFYSSCSPMYTVNNKALVSPVTGVLIVHNGTD